MGDARRSRLKDPRLGQRRNEATAIAALAEIRPQFVGDVPGEQQGEFRLFAIELLLVENRYARAGNILVQLVRSADLGHAVDEAVVKRRVVDQGARARWCADAKNARAPRLDVPEQRQEIELGADDAVAKRAEGRSVGQAGFLFVRQQRGDGWIDRLLPLRGRINPDRASVRRDALYAEYVHVVAVKQIDERRQGVVAQMLMIDGVVLQRLDQR